MKCLLSVFFLIFIFFTNIQCNIKWDSVVSDRAEIIHNILQSNPFNKSSHFSSVPSVSFSGERNLSVDFNVEKPLSEGERGRVCLKNITECIDKDDRYQSTTNRLSSYLFSSIPPFDLSNINGISEECRQQSRRYMEDLRAFKMWAVKMYDSTAKLPSGILNGNINQFGDFDMCIGAYSERHNIKGQYCLAAMEVKAPQSSYLTGLYALVHAHHHFRSRLEDPGHRVPRFSSINWALCVPSACSPREVELGLRRTVNKILEGTELQIRYEVDPSMCQKAVEQEIPLSTYIAVFVFGAIISWELFSTIYDHFAVENKNKWLMAFSLKENFMRSISLKRSSGDIEAVHGIRCLNALLLLASHKSMATFFLPYSNRTEYVEYVGRPFSVLGRAASLYTDPFIMMSSMLTTYSLIGRLNRDKKINVAQEYVSRLFRIVPTFAAIIAFCTFILPWINNGPLWNLVVTHHSEICKKYWWRNLLFIHNYFGFKDMCLTHTHHVGIDTQLFFVSPFLIYLIWKWPRRGSMALITLATVSTIMRFYVSYTLRLSNYVHFGTSVQQLFDTADNMYILPAHRATVYIMGILLGYILRNFNNMFLTKAQINVGNTLALCSFCLSFFGPAFMGKIDYVYDPLDAAWYAAISPILWCFSFAWIIFTWHLGYKGLPGLIFSNKLFTLWTKISYTVYLTQFPIYFYNVGSTRSSSEAGFFRLILNLKEYVWVVGLSAILTLTFEIPFQNVRQILLKRKQSEKVSTVSNSEEKQKVS